MTESQNQTLKTIFGVVFSKRTREWVSKTGMAGDTKYLTLETTRPYTYENKETEHKTTKHAKTFPEFVLDFNLSWYGIEQGDLVEIEYYLKGEDQKWKDKVTGEPKSMHKTEVVIASIKKILTDPAEDTKKAHYGAMSDVNELEDITKGKKPEVFTGVAPQSNSKLITPLPGDDDYDDQLPF